MAGSKTSEMLSSSSGEKIQLVHVKLPSFPDDNFKSEVLQTHSRTCYTELSRESLFISISHILKPATHFVDSVLLDKEVTKMRVELESFNLLEFDSALTELRNWGQTLSYVDNINLMMGMAVDKDKEILDEIIVDQVPIDILQFLSDQSWDEKAVFTMGCLALKFVELLELLLHGPNQSSIDLGSSMAYLKKNPISLDRTPIEKFQQALDQLNGLIKITLELVQYICELMLLQDTQNNREDLVLTGVYWTILSAVAGYIQITLITDNNEVALELSNLISSLNQILDDLKYHYRICKPQIEEMEAHIQSIALLDNIFDTENQSSEAPTDILELMKKFTYSKDGQQSLYDGSSTSKVEMEVLKGKDVLLVISNLEISTEEIDILLKIYEETREEDRYRIVWIPFVLKWTEELIHKFDNLKSNMPWYTVCYDSPVEGLWYFKGRWFFEEPSTVLINSLGEINHRGSIAEVSRNVFLISSHHEKLIVESPEEIIVHIPDMSQDHPYAEDEPPRLGELYKINTSLQFTVTYQYRTPSTSAPPTLGELYKKNTLPLVIGEQNDKVEENIVVIPEESEKPLNGFQGLLLHARKE